jgi:hypothetical protein|tara:strand:+ start:1359 stop:1757 length:399 start_codon:yes stop_codon:yes gene_type:complete
MPLPLAAIPPAAAAATRLASRLGPGVSRLMRRLGKGKPPRSSVPQSGPQVPTDSGVSGMVRRGVGAARNPALRDPEQFKEDPEGLTVPEPINIRDEYRKLNKKLEQLTKPKPKLASSQVRPTRKPLNRKNRG